VFNHVGGATPALSPDGVHFNEAGYRLLADAVRASLPSHLSAATTVLCIGDSLTFGIGVRPVGASERANENYLYPTYPAQLAEGISGAAQIWRPLRTGANFRIADDPAIVDEKRAAWRPL
jgi:lysophospholipase L1-like esterase